MIVAMMAGRLHWKGPDSYLGQKRGNSQLKVRHLALLGCWNRPNNSLLDMKVSQ